MEFFGLTLFVMRLILIVPYCSIWCYIKEYRKSTAMEITHLALEGVAFLAAALVGPGDNVRHRLHALGRPRVRPADDVPPCVATSVRTTGRRTGGFPLHWVCIKAHLCVCPPPGLVVCGVCCCAWWRVPLRFCSLPGVHVGRPCLHLHHANPRLHGTHAAQDTCECRPGARGRV